MSEVALLCMAALSLFVWDFRVSLNCRMREGATQAPWRSNWVETTSEVIDVKKRAEEVLDDSRKEGRRISPNAEKMCSTVNSMAIPKPHYRRTSRLVNKKIRSGTQRCVVFKQNVNVGASLRIVYEWIQVLVERCDVHIPLGAEATTLSVRRLKTFVNTDRLAMNDDNATRRATGFELSEYPPR